MNASVAAAAVVVVIVDVGNDVTDVVVHADFFHGCFCCECYLSYCTSIICYMFPGLYHFPFFLYAFLYHSGCMLQLVLVCAPLSSKKL